MHLCLFVLATTACGFLWRLCRALPIQEVLATLKGVWCLVDVCLLREMCVAYCLTHLSVSPLPQLMRVQSVSSDCCCCSDFFASALCSQSRNYSKHKIEWSQSEVLLGASQQCKVLVLVQDTRQGMSVCVAVCLVCMRFRSGVTTQPAL